LQFLRLDGQLFHFTGGCLQSLGNSNNIISVNESTAYNFFPFSDKCITELGTTTAEYEVDALSKYFQMITLKKFAELFGTTPSLEYPSF
jgi:hypothetical protein